MKDPEKSNKAPEGSLTSSIANIGTLVYREEIFESVELSYFTPALYKVEIPEVYVCRTRESGYDTFFTTLVYMIFPDLDISKNSLTFSGMIPANFKKVKGKSPPVFSEFHFYEYGQFKFYPDYRIMNTPEIDVEDIIG